MTENQGLPPYRSGQITCCGESLVAAIAAFLAHHNVAGISKLLPSLERVIDEAGPDAIERLGQRLSLTGMDWSYYASDPLVRRIHQIFADHFLTADMVILGTEHLAVIADKPVVMFINHLSYSDAHVLDFLLHKVAAVELADRLTVLAGPKVYSSSERRFSSLSFATIKTPQSNTRSTEEAVMNSREVAHAAHCSLQVAQERLRHGDALVVFAEGSRSRSGQMQPLLSGTARFLQSPNTWVLPLGIAGTERLSPISEDLLHPVPVTLRIGRPIQASVLGEFAQGARRLIMDCVGFAIAELLPHEYRGCYEAAVGLDEQARRLSREVFG